MKSERDKSNLNDMTNMTDPEECKTGTKLPVPVVKTGIKEMAPMKAEVVENAPPVVIRATGCHTPHFWMPWLPYPVTAQGVFDLALTVRFVDPARQQLRFFYEAQLKYECERLIPHPIPSFYPKGILKALMLRRSNPGFFICYAIDIVLTRYLNELNMENNYVQF